MKEVWVLVLLIQTGDINIPRETFVERFEYPSDAACQSEIERLKTRWVERYTAAAMEYDKTVAAFVDPKNKRKHKKQYLDRLALPADGFCVRAFK